MSHRVHAGTDFMWSREEVVRPRSQTVMSLIPTNLRTGLASSDVVIKADNGLSTQINALMGLFVEDATRVAGECAIASGRNIVSEDDMKDALKYVAQVFDSSADLEERFEAAVTTLQDEEFSSEGESDGATDAPQSQPVSDEECDREADTCHDVAKYHHTKRLVQQAIQNWPTWDPSDAVQILTKRAIDRTCASLDGSDA